MSRRLLFAGVSTMRDHAGQHKLYFIADAFARKGIPVSVLVPDLDDNHAFLDSRPYIDAQFYPPGGVLSDMRCKALQLANGDWSAVWVVGVGLRSLTLRGWWARDVPIIKDFDEFPSMIGSFGPMRRSYLKWIERQMITQANGFTCASAFLENTVRRQRPNLAARLLRLPVAISEHEHRVDPQMVAKLRAADGDRPVLLYIGSVNRFYEDQLDEIIRLAKLLHQRRSNAIVRILGGGPDLEYFKAKARSADVGDTLQFAGQVGRHELASHMDAARVLLFPFAANPFNLSRCPTKAFHYAASNRPVVTNRTGEVAELLGESALYYPEHDVEAMADRCEQALRNVGHFDNGIVFETLTWEARAREFERWLYHWNWLPDSRLTSAGSLERQRLEGSALAGARNHS